MKTYVNMQIVLARALQLPLRAVSSIVFLVMDFSLTDVTFTNF